MTSRDYVLVPTQSSSASSSAPTQSQPTFAVPTGRISSCRTQLDSEQTVPEVATLTTQPASVARPTEFVSPPSKSIKRGRKVREGKSEDIMWTESGSTEPTTLTTTTTGTGMENASREYWTNRHERILSLVALLVGFGNVWRFPYNCLQWGGAFIIPYILINIVVGVPIVYLELIVGQYTSLSPPGLFANLQPIMCGLGWAMTLLNFLRAPYYNIIMAWCAFYFGHSFQKPLPWTTCNNSWNTAECFSTPENFVVNSSFSQEQRDMAFVDRRDDFSPFEFFNFHLYTINTHSLGTGHLRLPLTLCLLATWLLTFLCLVGGMRAIGLIVYFTTPVPLFVLAVLTVVGLSLKGAGRGIAFYLTPNVTVLFNASLWKAAGTQVLFSSSAAMGGVITLGSFSKFHNNCFVDTLWAIGVNALASVLSGFTVFSALGSMSERYNITIKHVVADVGPELAFVAYAQALGQIGDFGVVISVLFFLACIFLGLDTQFIDIECIIVALCDRWPWLLRKRILVALSICVTCFALGLPMCTERGIFVFRLLHQFDVPYGLTYLAILEVVSIMYFYGWRRLLRDIGSMMGRPRSVLGRWLGHSGIVWQWLLFAVETPLLSLVLLAIIWEGYVTSCCPNWVNVIGYVIAFVPFWMVVLFGVAILVHQLYKNGPIRRLFKPTRYYCPAHKRPIQKVSYDRNKSEKTALLDLTGLPPLDIPIKRVR